MSYDLKRKKVLPLDMCAWKGCRKDKGLKLYNITGNGCTAICDKHFHDDMVPWHGEVPEVTGGTEEASEVVTSAEGAIALVQGQEGHEKPHAEAERGKAQAIREHIQGMTFENTPDGMAYASQVLHALIAAKEELDNRRTAATKPLNAALREINSWFKPAIDAYDEAVSSVRTRIIMARGQVKEGMDNALRELQRAYDANDEEAVAVALGRHNMLAPATDSVPGLTFSEHWGWEIVDFDAIPRQYLMVNSPLLQSEVKANKGNATIPGIRVFPFPRVARKAS